MPRRAAFAFLVLLLLGCGESEEGPYLELAGGGFIFNYRNAEASYGFVARVLRRIPPDTVLEAAFEDPAGGADIVVRQTARRERISYKFETPSVSGVIKGRDYHAELRLIETSEQGAEAVIARYAWTFRSSQGQEVLPSEPLSVGPGYHRPDGSIPTPEQGGRDD